jgi:hypothetical protein
VERYRQTPMAKASGPATEDFLPGDFTHAASGVHYRVFLRDGAAWLSFSRGADHGREALAGEERLLYYLGSNHRGRTYLYQHDSLWFETPVNYYARGGWDMAPNHLNDPSMPDDLPIQTGCLHCHATWAAAPRMNARNSFPDPPFSQGGVGCNACHGDPTAHLAAKGRGPILNPDKLQAAKRDSVCTQCHLEGNATIDRPGRSLATFRPGDNLNEDTVYFVLAEQASGGARATSQWEALAASACKRAVGDKLTCTTCHDPHGDPQGMAARVEYFRARCLSCHNSPQLAAQHHPQQRNCATCHMPRLASTDIAHDQVKDHNIERRPHDEIVRRDAAAVELVPVSGFTASDRELGLAYAQWANAHNDETAGRRALILLQRAEKEGASDEVLHDNPGFLEQRAGQIEAAEQEYREALSVNPYVPVAATNLAILDLREGRAQEAEQMLQRLVDADPAQTRAGLTLALIDCLAGRGYEARELTLKLQQYAHDSAEVRAYCAAGRTRGLRARRCKPRAEAV